MYKNQATINLMRFNNKAFKGLHNLSHMNFEDLFICMEFAENFTHKRVLDKFSKRANELNNASAFKDIPLSIEDYNVYILWEDTRSYFNNHMLIAEVDKYGFNVTRESMNWNSGYSYNLNNLYTKSDFEEQRKNPKVHWWLVAQPKNMALQNNTTGLPDIVTDSWMRYHVTDISHYFKSFGGGQKYIGMITVQQNHRRNDRPFNIYDYYGDTKAEDVNELIDKSGYFKYNVHRRYYRRLRELRKDRAKQIVDNMNCIEMLKPIQSVFNDIKDILYALVMDKTTWNDSKKLEVVSHAMDNVADFTEKLDNYIAVSNDKHWVNCEEVKKCLDNFNARLRRIKEIMREGDISV